MATLSVTDTFDSYDVTIGCITWHVKDRCFSEEFEREAVKLVGQPGASKAAIARDLGVGANLLGRWSKAANVGGQVGGGEKISSQEYERMRRETSVVARIMKQAKLDIGKIDRELRGKVPAVPSERPDSLQGQD